MKCDKLRFEHVTSKCSEVAFLTAEREDMFRTAVEGIEQLGARLRGMLANWPSEQTGTKQHYAPSCDGVKNPKYSRTKGGWLGSRRGGAEKKQCSNCHRHGHNKQTCTYKNSQKGTTSKSSAAGDGDEEDMANDLEMEWSRDMDNLDAVDVADNLEPNTESEPRTQDETDFENEEDAIHVKAIKTEGWWGRPLGLI